MTTNGSQVVARLIQDRVAYLAALEKEERENLYEAMEQYRKKEQRLNELVADRQALEAYLATIEGNDDGTTIKVGDRVWVKYADGTLCKEAHSPGGQPHKVTAIENDRAFFGPRGTTSWPLKRLVKA